MHFEVKHTFFKFTENNIAAILRDRRAHTRFYSLASRWLTPFFQSDSRAAALTGGKKHAAGAQFYTPTVLANVTRDMRVNTEEIFGPVACAIPADSYEHAPVLANDSEFGLSAGICTTSLKYASHFKRHAQAGMVMVNVPTAGVDYHVPFGGRKKSSYGPREQGSYAKDFYTVMKTAYTAS